MLEQPDLLTTVAGQLLQFGVLGIALLASLYGNWLQWKENNRLQEARVGDAKANTVAFSDLTKNATAAITAQTGATEAGTEAVRDLREALRRGAS